MVSEDKPRRDTIWDSMLDAEMYGTYWQMTTSNFSSSEQVMRVFLAITSSATFVITLTPYTGPVLWKVLAVITAIVSIVNAVYFSSDKIANVSAAAGKWKTLAIEYQVLWGDGPAEIKDEGWKRFSDLKRSEAAIDTFKLGINEKRLEKAFEEVKKKRGGNHDERPQTR
jgi:hypothetical protein